MENVSESKQKQNNEKIEIVNNDLECFPTEFDEDDCNVFEVESLEDNEQWKQFLLDCDEWNKEPVEEEPYYPFEKIYTNSKPHFYIPSNDSYSEDEDTYDNMIVLGKITKIPKKKQSFKYHVGSSKNIMCGSLQAGNKKGECNNVKCKYAHKFTDIPFCYGKCGHITHENNFYSGNCNKRHCNETIDNFVLRKNIQLNDIKKIVLYFFERPNSELVESILYKASKIMVSEVKLKIRPPTDTLEEYFASRNKNK